MNPTTYQSLPSPKRFVVFSMAISDNVKRAGETNEEMTLHMFALRDKGWLTFQRTEPNYLGPLLCEFKKLDFIREITTDYIKTLHAEATRNVKHLLYEKDETGENKLDEFRGVGNGIGYNLSLRNSTVLGIKETLDKIEKGHPGCPEFMLTLCVGDDIINRTNVKEYRERNSCCDNMALATLIYKTKQEGKKVKLQSCIEPLNGLPQSSQNVQIVISKIMADYINEFNENIKKPDITPIEKLRIIAKFIRDCEQLHPFLDGNCRTICMLTLYKILAENNFPVPILSNPNRFDCCSIDELVVDLINGMEDTMKVAQGKMNLYGVTTEEILSVATPDEKKEAESLGISTAPPLERLKQYQLSSSISTEFNELEKWIKKIKTVINQKPYQQNQALSENIELINDAIKIAYLKFDEEKSAGNAVCYLKDQCRYIVKQSPSFSIEIETSSFFSFFKRKTFREDLECIFSEIETQYPTKGYRKE
jgi:hypothetical protein